MIIDLFLYCFKDGKEMLLFLVKILRFYSPLNSTLTFGQLFRFYCMSSTNLRSVIKGELLLDEAVDNLATEKKSAQANLCRTVTSLKPCPSAKFS